MGYFIWGMGRSGEATARYFQQKQIPFVAWDDSPAVRQKISARWHRLETQEEVNPKGLKHNGTETACHNPQDQKDRDMTWCDPMSYAWHSQDILILSPGIRAHHEPPQGVLKARQAGASIVSDVGLFLQLFAAQGKKIIGVTGTIGKSTTVSWLFHALKKAGQDVVLAGNIGIPVFDIAFDMARDPWCILELSSAQLETCGPLSLSLGLITPLFPSHLNHHGSVEQYYACKQRLIDGAQTVFRAPDWSAHEQRLWHQRFHDTCVPLSAISGFLVEQALHWMGLDPSKILECMQGFMGLPHRQERIPSQDGRLYVNDSKATNRYATEAALQTWLPDHRVHWILGGKADTTVDLKWILPWASQVAGLYLIGETQEVYAALLRERLIPYALCNTLECAVQQAKQQSQPGEVILFSPGSQSFDQFKDFEHRGEVFRGLV